MPFFEVSAFFGSLVAEIVTGNGTVKYLSHFWSRDDGSLGLIREQRVHVYVLPGGPLRPSYVTQAGCCQVQA
jgi:hypothetical protein